MTARVPRPEAVLPDRAFSHLIKVDLAMKQLSLPPSLQHARNAGSLLNPKAGVEKGCRVTAGKKMIAIAHAMAMAVPKPPADPLEARGCPA